ncbi:hypothetical protein LSH36_511g01113 [Paralvinella palmiformis]|uniref:Uncharacterized protein n=1 Tax=Paralvinella palmiformis TaxID=53620 RepID=A0AAD9J805_9ANNE|nr:hypothetical protein LSH36_511g01113 [Paralvinella palmiformis]
MGSTSFIKSQILLMNNMTEEACIYAEVTIICNFSHIFLSPTAVRFIRQQDENTSSGVSSQRQRPSARHQPPVQRSYSYSPRGRSMLQNGTNNSMPFVDRRVVNGHSSQDVCTTYNIDPAIYDSLSSTAANNSNSNQASGDAVPVNSIMSSNSPVMGKY